MNTQPTSRGAMTESALSDALAQFGDATGVGPASFAELATGARLVELAAGEVLDPGEGPWSAYIVVGRAEVTIRNAPIGTRAAGELVEVPGGLPTAPRVTAVTPLRALILAGGVCGPMRCEEPTRSVQDNGSEER